MPILHEKKETECNNRTAYEDRLGYCEEEDRERGEADSLLEDRGQDTGEAVRTGDGVILRSDRDMLSGEWRRDRVQGKREKWKKEGGKDKRKNENSYFELKVIYIL